MSFKSDISKGFDKFEAFREANSQAVEKGFEWSKTHILPILADVGLGLMSYVSPETADTIRDNFNRARRAQNLSDYQKALRAIQSKLNELNIADEDAEKAWNKVQDKLYKITNYSGGNVNSHYRSILADEAEKLEAQKDAISKARTQRDDRRNELADAANLASAKFSAGATNKSMSNIALKPTHAVDQALTAAIEERINR